MSVHPTSNEHDDPIVPEVRAASRGRVNLANTTDGEDWASCRPGRLLVIERRSAVFGE